MKGFDEREGASDCVSDSDSSKASFSSSWSTFLTSAYSILDPYRQSASHTRRNDWTSAVKRIVSGGSMRRFQERVLGSSKTGVSNSTSDIWLLGLCYNISAGDEASGLTAFEQDFSSRIITTYRKGFDVIGDSGYTSDVNWGCMLRSSQMLFAQALIFHKFGRAWRKSLSKPLNEEYIEILHLFVDSVASPFSIHNLIQAGNSYGLAAGSWVGPYAVCRSWEALVRSKRESIDDGELHFPMALYVVSGDEDGERGGAPVLCIEDAKKHCTDFSHGRSEWTPILLLVPLVLGLEKVNPRYMSSLRATFSFPQSLGILGGKPGASTYMIGVQDDEVFYLDPHEVQTVVKISKDNLEADTSSYHCSTIRHIPLDSLDPSLAIGFYCRDKGDFDDFCSRASKLAEESNGAPLFTVAKTHGISKPVSHSDGDSVGTRDGQLCEDPMIGGDADADGDGDDEWQLL